MEKNYITTLLGKDDEFVGNKLNTTYSFKIKRQLKHGRQATCFFFCLRNLITIEMFVGAESVSRRAELSRPEFGNETTNSEIKFPIALAMNVCP